MSQNDQIFAYLKKGNTLTALEALDLFGCMNLKGRINELKKDHDIDKKMVKTRSGKRVARYFYKTAPQPEVQNQAKPTETAPSSALHGQPLAEGIETRPPLKTPENGLRVCKLEACRREFLPKTYNQLFCCKQHKDYFYNNTKAEAYKAFRFRGQI